jgi:hypothetical protein
MTTDSFLGNAAFNLPLVPELDAARANMAKISALVDEVLKDIEAHLRSNGRMNERQWDVIEEHAKRVPGHLENIANRAGALLSTWHHAFIAAQERTNFYLPMEEMVETETAYDQDRLDRLDARDISDALEFNTERKDTFGFASCDEEIGTAVDRAFEKLLVKLEDGDATVPGIVVTVLKTFMQAHRRGFSRYYTGIDTWPRPSAVVQVEIDQRMPDALDWLRYELSEALREEAELAKPKGEGENER